MDGPHGCGKGSSACGGLIRDVTSMFLEGFHCKVTSSNVVWAELWGVLPGLRLAREVKLLNIIVGSDSKSAIDMIHRRFSPKPAFRFLVEELLSLARKSDWRVDFHHIFRSANSCVDHLANKERALRVFLLVFSGKPLAFT